MAAETRGPQIAAIAYTFMIMSSISTLLRIYCRGYVIKAFGLDDWLAVIAQFLFIVFCAYELTGVTYGTGQHLKNLSDEAIPKAMQMWWTCEPLYVLSNMAIKASIAVFLLRLCITKTHRMIIWVVVGVTEIYSLFFFLLFVLQCRPTALFWLRYTGSPPEGSCLDASVVSNAFYGYSAISCWTDWTYSILPVFLVWNLQMNTKVKISVIGILAAGCIASSATIVRFPYLYSLTDINDFLYSTSDVAIWSTVETGLGITAAGVATLRPLLKSWFGGGSSARGNGTSARQWHRTGSRNPTGEDAFDLHDVTAKQRFGVTTVIDYNNKADNDVEGQKNKEGDTESEASGSGENWNSSQSNLADRAQEGRGAQNPWNAITVKKSIVQTRG
ncbi:hypothetical protein BKA67DRAFT_639150 [Truncatella angustata]|uniref:Rhodopsin domain-containing protein n=1 Tax=Truncatella angustata TaxID=152316 RepID=A0A9P8UC95_9PEZI|nr:uncharacterized protein BKA67DRAFT_639150 [Truncatella angustata]KAH6647117.1 hypothetical protein BKA67DRAFT_639150 [Truncatella angustata]